MSVLAAGADLLCTSRVASKVWKLPEGARVKFEERPEPPQWPGTYEAARVRVI